MPYTMAIYEDEEKKYPVPKDGDLFRVKKVWNDITDLHWGKCVVIDLEPVKESEIADNPMDLL